MNQIDTLILNLKVKVLKQDQSIFDVIKRSGYGPPWLEG